MEADAAELDRRLQLAPGTCLRRIQEGEQGLMKLKLDQLKLIRKYFGDKYLEDGNDYGIINHKNVIGYKIDKVEDTFKILKYLLEYNN